MKKDSVEKNIMKSASTSVMRLASPEPLPDSTQSKSMQTPQKEIGWLLYDGPTSVYLGNSP